MNTEPIQNARSNRQSLIAAVMQTPVGDLVAVVDSALDGALVRLDFAHPEDALGSGDWRGLAVDWNGASGAAHVVSQVKEYFAGTRRSFDLALAQPYGGTFDREVWRALPQLAPFGTTVTYGEIATRLGRPGAARAVGRANATNPISLVVPCHRVVGAGGRLVGYGGGEGVSTKRALINHEASNGSAEGFVLETQQ